jgi:hypothetical protein
VKVGFVREVLFIAENFVSLVRCVVLVTKHNQFIVHSQDGAAKA